MEAWLAAGDETGDWDIVDGRFSGGCAGIAWVLGPAEAWSRALQSAHGGASALAAFSQPIAARLPPGTLQDANDKKKYHVLDVWSHCRRQRIEGVIDPAAQHPDPVLELLRGDINWLLRSGLGVLAVGGSPADAKAAGLGISGDGLRERARAFAGLMTVALPFIPGDAVLHLLVEGRTESVIADAARHNRFAESASGQARLVEPYRDFVAFLTEDLARASARCGRLVASGGVVGDFRPGGRIPLRKSLSDPRSRCGSFLQANAERAAAAMNGIADLAAALVHRPPGASGSRFDLDAMVASTNLWSGNYRELGNAIRA